MPGLGYVRNMIANTVIEMEMPAYLAYRTANQKYADQFADQFAKWMAYNELANDPIYQGKEELSAEEKNRIEKNAEALAENIRSSQGFQEMFKSDNPKETIEMLCGNQETWRSISSPRPLDYATVRERFLRKLTRFDERREQAKDIVERLKETSSKTLTGKLKSFFVGNSKEYDTAFKAMQDLSNGKTTPEQAKDAIKNYLDIRKDKVRNHEYGRDRFKLMMQGLQSVMKPQEFADYCKSVDADRAVRSKGNYHGETHPEDYYPTRSAKKNVAEMIQNAKDKQPTMRDAARMAAVYLITYGDQEDGWEPDRELDPSVIRIQADGIEKDPQFKKWFKEQTPEKLRELMSSEKGFKKVGEFKHELEKAERREQMLKQQQEQEKKQAELEKQKAAKQAELEKQKAELEKQKAAEQAKRNQKYLDTLRKNGKNFSGYDLIDYAKYVGRHPEVREEAEKIIKDQGLDMKLPDPPKKEQNKTGPDKNGQGKNGPDKTKQSYSPQL